MPKCEKCQYLVRTSYEYSEYACEIFGEYDGTQWEDGKIIKGDDYDMFTEEGCRYHWKTLAKMAKENAEALAKQYEGYGEWYEKEQLKEQIAIQNKVIEEMFREGFFESCNCEICDIMCDESEPRGFENCFKVFKKELFDRAKRAYEKEICEEKI